MLRISQRLPDARSPQLQLVLPFDLRSRSRFRARLVSGEEVGVVLARGQILRGGDLLLTEDDRVVEVVAASECVSTLRAADARLLARVAYHLGISRIELAQIEAALRIRRGSFTREPTRDAAQQLGEAYRVLETPATANNEEIVKAYRRQLSRHHPDKLKANGLPDSMIEHAKERTQQIIEAYELIREQRRL